MLKTGEYSGLGVYHPDVNNDVDPPTDHGLEASNPDLLRAAKDAGVKYLHGNMSFVSHQPQCFNCARVHPLEPSLLVVPDWPTNIAYFSTTPAEETYFYNSYYGPNGKFPFWPVNQNYTQILDNEANQALSHVATGSIYTHTLHIGNLRDYGSGKTLATDWLDRVMSKYTAFYKVPLLSPDWPVLAAYTATRNSHFTQLASVRRGVRPDREQRDDHLVEGGPGAGQRGQDGRLHHLRHGGLRGHHADGRHSGDVHPDRSRMKIALVSEGTYPYAMGGVSVWCDQLIRGLPDYRWEVIALTVDGSERPAWPAPDNLDEVRSIPLWSYAPQVGGAPRPRRGGGRRAAT